MDRPLSLDEFRQAVADLTGALTDHRTMDDNGWDHAITTLLVAREQYGGRVRQLLQAILSVGRGRPDRPLSTALTELHCHLALADDDTPPHPNGIRASRARTHPKTDQLTLFVVER